jgi:deoxyribodipyrimidine photo-lyase
VSLTDPVVVWHRDDLRLADNPALEAAAEAGDPVPVFVFDPAFYGEHALACDARIEFLFECLAGLRERYRDRGGDLRFLTGSPLDRLDALRAHLDAPVYYTHTTTARHGRERERSLDRRDGYTGFEADAIRRTADEPRDGWQAQAEAYFQAEPATPPADLPSPPVENDLTLAAARERFAVSPEKRSVPKGGRRAAMARLDRFTETIDRYPGSISAPADAERYCSRLSPYLAMGVLSPREALQHVREHAVDGAGQRMFVERLFWNQHFTQKLADDPALTERAINPVFRGLHREEHEPALVEAWQRGETGFPLVDAAMRALVETGYINFRMRALVATFFCHVLREWWKRGADFMYYHLIDAEAAINYAQWQMQGGLVGVHPLRIYDPAKNTREHDPEGEFVREYVPELQPVPDEHLPRPGGMSRARQADVGVRLGETYPRPVVDFDARREQTRAQHGRLADRAREALSDPAVSRRASLSSRHESVDRPARTESQASLDEF